MITEDLDRIRVWFDAYVRTFAGPGEALAPPMLLKAEHSERVAWDARDLARDLGWSRREVNLAEAAGLLHDIGRFSQFLEFGTFHDAVSIDHGLRGREVLDKSLITSSLVPSERDCLTDAVRYHNAKALPDHLDGNTLPLARLIRDADKLDVFRVVLESVERDGFKELPRMLPKVRLGGPLSPSVIDDVRTNRFCSIDNVESLGDFLLMQLAWVYDVNFEPTFRRILDRGIISRIARNLAEDQPAVMDIVEEAKLFVTKRKNNCRGS